MPSAAHRLALEVRDLSRTFGARKALDGVSFELPAGAFLSIFGPNGAGKTTLRQGAHHAARPRRRARRRCVGLDVVEDAVELRERIGLISHNPLLYPDLTAEENLEFFADMYGLDDPKARIRELLERRRARPPPPRPRAHVLARHAAAALDRARAAAPPRRASSSTSRTRASTRTRWTSSTRSSRRSATEHTFVMISHDLAKGLELCSHALILAQGQGRAVRGEGGDRRRRVRGDLPRDRRAWGCRSPWPRRPACASRRAAVQGDPAQGHRHGAAHQRDAHVDGPVHAARRWSSTTSRCRRPAPAFDVRLIAGGLLWLAFVFTSMLGLNRSLVHEKDQGCLEALLLSPVDRPVIFFAQGDRQPHLPAHRRGAHRAAVLLPVPVRASGFGGPLWMLALVAARRRRSASRESARCLRRCR